MIFLPEAIGRSIAKWIFIRESREEWLWEINGRSRYRSVAHALCYELFLIVSFMTLHLKIGASMSHSRS